MADPKQEVLNHLRKQRLEELESMRNELKEWEQRDEKELEEFLRDKPNLCFACLRLQSIIEEKKRQRTQRGYRQGGRGRDQYGY